MKKFLLFFVLFGLSLSNQFILAKTKAAAARRMDDAEKDAIIEVEPFLKSSVNLSNVQHNVTILRQQKLLKQDELKDFIDTVDMKVIKPLKSAWDDLSIDFNTRIIAYENALNSSRQKADSPDWPQAVADMHRLLKKIHITINQILDFSQQEKETGPKIVSKKNRAVV